jgi:hypothetical protein
MTRWLPLLIILVALAALGLYFGPNLYRGALFKRDLRGLLDAARAGDKAKALSYIESSQQNSIAPLVMNRVPDDYHQRIAVLKLGSWQRADPATIWALVTLRVDHDGVGGLYQGKLRWVYDAAARRWWWDFAGSYGSAYPLSGEPDWRPLSEALEYAGAL